MTFDPSAKMFRGEIVQIKPSWVSVIAKKFGGDISKAPAPAIDVISTPKEVSVKAIEEGLKKPIIETKTPETINTPTIPETMQPEGKSMQITPLEKPIATNIDGYVPVEARKSAETPAPFKFVPPETTEPVLKMEQGKNNAFGNLTNPETTPALENLRTKPTIENLKLVAKTFNDFPSFRTTAPNFLSNNGIDVMDILKKNNIDMQTIYDSVNPPEKSIPSEEMELTPEVEAKANEDWENNPIYAEKVGELADQVTELENKLKEFAIPFKEERIQD
jgi:hypothetical protein